MPHQPLEMQWLRASLSQSSRKAASQGMEVHNTPPGVWDGFDSILLAYLLLVALFVLHDLLTTYSLHFLDPGIGKVQVERSDRGHSLEKRLVSISISWTNGAECGDGVGV
ncbi:MAG: hypothetical protein O7G85_00600 [Planctomycetota bacterium]|nr:hypothetical protein [Planctomycetota bacterium]